MTVASIIVRDAVEHHLPRHQFEVLKVAEQSERDLLRAMIGQLDAGEAAP